MHRPTPDYAELHALSNFSFLRGASHPEELVERAHALGYRALALTDECSLAGVVRAHVAARALGLPLIVGSELTLSADAGDPPALEGTRLVLLATDRAGYGRLARLITRARRRAAKGRYRALPADLEAGLPGCLALLVPGGDEADLARARWLAARFPGAAWIAVALHLGPDDPGRLAHARRLGAAAGLPLVAAGDVHMHVRSRRALADTLTAIRLGVPLAEAGTALAPNGERHLRPRERLARIHPPELLAETVRVAERCRFSLDALRYEYPEEVVPPGETPSGHLRRLTLAGLRRRWPQGAPMRVRRQVVHELGLIAELGYERYFLTVHDVVTFARRRGILCQGRGSAANSAVCYCLGITEVDPSRMDMLFERFVSRERDEPPDIDVDFEHERREEVLQYLYEKYGRERAGLAATVIRYRTRSAVRDVARALGLPPAQADALAREARGRDGPGLDAEHIRAAGLDPDTPVMRRLQGLVAQLIGFPRHLSQHVGGMVIARGRLDELVPIENAAMDGRTVIQWDKDDLDALGLMKIDCLALGMLTAIRKACALIGEQRGRPFTLADIPPEDPATYAMIQRADTIGVFQIESRAQMAMLPRLKPACYYDLVIEVAIIRPGPIQGEMVHPYLRRRAGLEPVSYPSEAVRAVLERTLGVPIFQEQVIRLAQVAAGFTPGEADRLRRSMAAWRRSGDLAGFERRLIDGMRARGYPERFARQIYQQILGFGEYGFPECVTGDTRIVDAETGERVRIDDLAHRRRKVTWTLACDDAFRLVPRRIREVRIAGRKPVWRVRTALGHVVTASAEHPFLTIDGWRRLELLKPGDRIAAARTVPCAGSRRWPRHRIVLLAALIAEGNLCHPGTLCYYTTDRGLRDEFAAAVERFPNSRAVFGRHRGCHVVRVRRRDPRRQAGAVRWLRGLGVWGLGAREKHLPEEVFTLTPGCIALFLARLWEGDGGLAERAGHVSYETASGELARDVRDLLLRLGIVSRLHVRTRPWRGRRLPFHVVAVTGREQLQRFWQTVGRRFLDAERRRRARVLSTRREGRMSRDIIPVSTYRHVRSARRRRGPTRAALGREAGVAISDVRSPPPVKQGLRRGIIGQPGRALDPGSLTDLACPDIHWDRIVAIESCAMAETYDLAIEGDHNFIANNLVVHNSHSASFALLAYASAWLKCHHPAAFLAALLNSQPLGFYAPAQLVADARRHGVTVRPVDVTASRWDCTLEHDEGRAGPAVRLGLRMVKGLGEAAAARIVAARSARAFTDVADLARRAALDRGALEALAAADALGPLAGHRHRARWAALGVERPAPLLADAPVPEGLPLLRAPTEGESVVDDYAATGLTLRRHPLALLRARLDAEGVVSAAAVDGLADGAPVRAGGLVITRQRPGTATGVVFLTLEDETGQINVIVWRDRFERHRRAVLHARLLLVEGTVQREGEVVHVVARRLVDRSALLGGLTVRSRDFA